MHTLFRGQSLGPPRLMNFLPKISSALTHEEL